MIGFCKGIWAGEEDGDDMVGGFAVTCWMTLMKTIVPMGYKL